MLDAISKIAEQKIREAQERGEFDNLEGQGRPQNLDEYMRLPEDMRMAYTILKNANCLPPEVMIKNEILQIEDMLSLMTDEEEKYRQIKKLNFFGYQAEHHARRPGGFRGAAAVLSATGGQNKRGLEKGPGLEGQVSRTGIRLKRRPGPAFCV